MMKFLKNILLSLFMDKKARKKLAATRRNTKAPGRRRVGAAADREENIQRIREAQKQVATPERQELIRQALAVQRAKAKILDDLSDEDRKKLVAAAMRAFMAERDANSK